jgi:lactobin A/cerein 7B family class IIb bacteriocin
MTTQMTIDKTAELSNQELSLEQLEDVQGGVAPLVVAGGIAAGAAAAYGAYKLGKWLVKKVGEATTNLDSDGDSGCGDGRDCGDGANKLSFYAMREPTTLIV